MYNQIAIQPQNIKSCNQSPAHHLVGVGLHAQPGLSGHLTLTSIIYTLCTTNSHTTTTHKSCNQSPTHHPIGVGLHAQPGLTGHLTLTSIIQLPYTNTPTSCRRGHTDRQTDRQTDIQKFYFDQSFIVCNYNVPTKHQHTQW